MNAVGAQLQAVKDTGYEVVTNLAMSDIEGEESRLRGSRADSNGGDLAPQPAFPRPSPPENPWDSTLTYPERHVQAAQVFFLSPTWRNKFVKYGHLICRKVCPTVVELAGYVF